MVTTMAGLQLARERMPRNPTPLLARMTSGFAIGQIAGPLFVRFIGDNQHCWMRCVEPGRCDGNRTLGKYRPMAMAWRLSKVNELGRGCRDAF